MSNQYLDDVQAKDISRAVSIFENARSLRAKWAGYRGLSSNQVRAMIEQAARSEQRPGDVISAFGDGVVMVGPATDAARSDFERQAAENTASLERAERTQARGVGAAPGTPQYMEAVEASRRIPGLLELQEAYAVHLSRPWPTAEELRAGVAVVAAPILLLIRQRAAAAAFERLLAVRQRAEDALRGLDGYEATAREFVIAAGRDLAVAGWEQDDVAALRRITALEFVRTDEKEKVNV